MVFDSVTRTQRTPDAGTWDRLWERESHLRHTWQVTAGLWKMLAAAHQDDRRGTDSLERMTGIEPA